MPKQNYWIASVGGEYALVEGADQRDLWTKVRGWRPANEPGLNDQVYVTHADPAVGTGRIPYSALSGGWSELGWTAGPPPEPIDITKDPVLVDQPPAPVEPVAPKTPAAAGGVKDKE